MALQPLDFYPVRASYDAVTLFGTIAAESFRENGNCKGRGLARRLHNRTLDLETGMAFIDGNGVRNLDQDIFAFDTGSRSMMVNLQKPMLARSASSCCILNILALRTIYR